MVLLSVAKNCLSFGEEKVYFCNPREDIPKCVDASYLTRRDLGNIIRFKTENYNQWVTGDNSYSQTLEQNR